MKYTICILLCTLFLVNSVHSLNGGAAVALGTHPSHALVLVSDAPRGGVIVNANHVVTSCRNVLSGTNELLAPTQFVIRAGSITLNEGFLSQVSAVFPHPEFNPWTFNNDVAVLRTVTAFPFEPNNPTPNIAPAMYNERVVAESTNCVVVGFNALGAGVAGLQQLQQPILNRVTQCNIVAVHNGRVLDMMLCAGTVGAGSGICPSTIGGGLYCFGNFTGIATSGDQCGLINSPGIFTQVRHHIPWINNQFTRAALPAGPTPAPGVSAGVLSTVTSSLLILLAFLFAKL